MDSSSAQHHHQEMGLQTLESMLACTKSPQQEKKPRPADVQSPKCPRCDSANTKFCYYNNYSLSQPRYFCKSCRRYWTKGGTLRNVPVGGGCRKNKRSSSSSSSATSSSSSKRTQDHPLPSIAYDSNDLSLAIARLHKQNSGHLGLDDRDFSIWAQQQQHQHQSMAHHHNHHAGGDVLGSFAVTTSSFDAMRSGFLENSSSGNDIHNLYYGMGSGNGDPNADVDNGGMGMNSGAHNIGMPYEEFGGGVVGSTVSTAVTTVKQEMCGGRDGDGRILWGFPWQSLAGDDNRTDLESTRLNWNGIASSNWQGLLNSPLM